MVRNEIQDFASTRTIFNNKFKLIILDECDAMTKDAQFALRRGETGQLFSLQQTPMLAVVGAGQQVLSPGSPTFFPCCVLQ